MKAADAACRNGALTNRLRAVEVSSGLFRRQSRELGHVEEVMRRAAPAGWPERLLFFQLMCSAPNDWDAARGISLLTKPSIEQKRLQLKAPVLRKRGSPRSDTRFCSDVGVRRSQHCNACGPGGQPVTRPALSKRTRASRFSYAAARSPSVPRHPSNSE